MIIRCEKEPAYPSYLNWITFYSLMSVFVSRGLVECWMKWLPLKSCIVYASCISNLQTRYVKRVGTYFKSQRRLWNWIGCFSHLSVSEKVKVYRRQRVSCFMPKTWRSLNFWKFYTNYALRRRLKRNDIFGTYGLGR